MGFDISLVPTDPLALGFTGADHKALADALAAAFPDPNKLNQLLVARLNQPLNGIAAPYPLSDATFEVVTFYKAKGHVLRLMAAARASQPDNPQLAFVLEKFRLATPTATAPQLEKLVKKTSVPFPVAVWRERLAACEVCVCRLELPTARGPSFGTGFLVAPDLVLTNYHVVAPAIAFGAKQAPADGLVADPSKVIARFDYKALDGKTTIHPGIEVKLAADWLLDSSPYSSSDMEAQPKQSVPSLEELDHAIIRLAEPIGSAPIPLGADTDPSAKPRGWITLQAAEWDFGAEPALFIVQHPNGAPMALAMDLDAKMQVNANKTRVTYQTGTEPGSSGSPCFNQFWSLVAIHHAGDPLYAPLQAGAYNEGIPIARIVDRLKAKNLTDGMTIA